MPRNGHVLAWGRTPLVGASGWPVGSQQVARGKPWAGYGHMYNQCLLMPGRPWRAGCPARVGLSGGTGMLEQGRTQFPEGQSGHT